MFVKIALLLVLCQGICFSYGSVLRQRVEQQKCSPIYGDCEKREDCCSNSGHLICNDDVQICLPVTDPVGPPPGAVEEAIAPPSSPGCSLLSDSCYDTLDCCAPYICDHTHQCVKETFLPGGYGGYGGYGSYGNYPAAIPGGHGHFNPGR